MLSFGRYILSAGAATVVDFALVQSLLSFAPFHDGPLFGLAIALGALAGMSANFVLSRRYVFRLDDRHEAAQLRSFFIVSLTTLILRVFVAYALLAFVLGPLLSLAGLAGSETEARLGHLGAAAIVTVYSYLAHKHVSFDGGVRSFLNRLVRPANAR